MGYIESGKEQGASLLLGGNKHGHEGFYIEPTVFADVTKEMKIGSEEIFGPVVAIIKFKTDEEVIKLANDTEFGLASAVFSQNIQRALNTANKIEAGTVWINCYNELSAEISFGGFKQVGQFSQSGINLMLINSGNFPNLRF